ncbi:hypothetical protein GCM10022221_13010 [Actinocorallia aurea]
MGLAEVTRESVFEALAEFDALGREEFLAKYGFGRARSYFLVHEGERYDSKAVVGAAHGFVRGRAALRPGEFSGGDRTVSELLRRLGFEVVREEGTRRRPPLTVEELSGGTWVERVEPRTARDGRPTLKYAVAILWALGRAARGLPRTTNWQETHDGLKPLLDEFCREGENLRRNPARAVNGLLRDGLWDLGPHAPLAPPKGGRPRSWYEAQEPVGGLVEVMYAWVTASEARLWAAVAAVEDFFELDDDAVRLLARVGLGEESGPGDEAGRVRLDAAAAGTWRPLEGDEFRELYATAVRLIERSEAPGRRQAVTTSRPARSKAAREAVLARSGGRCEYCGQDAPGVTGAGRPILEVDHVRELAAGGRDHPEQMIALCPNCHAVKTRGADRHAMAGELLERVARLHRDAGGAES